MRTKIKLSDNLKRHVFELIDELDEHVLDAAKEANRNGKPERPAIVRRIRAMDTRVKEAQWNRLGCIRRAVDMYEDGTGICGL